jgi:outer membrane receptor protein involved in Fe transport
LGEYAVKSRYLVSCAVAAIVSGTAGFASAADAAAAAAASANGPVAVEEVIVTANRRDESAQKVAATIQAFSSDTLTKLNVTDINQLLRFTPNVTLAANGPGQGSIFMRGLSSGSAGNQSSATVGNFPNVAVYLDDQSMQFPSRNIDIFVADIQRIEVLEGPQGTLFGGGAEAGALRYITNKPKLGVMEGKFEASYGYTEHGDNNSGFSAVLNVPFGDKLAVRGVLYSDRQGGYIDNVPSTYTHNNFDASGPAKSFCPTAGGGVASLAKCAIGNNYAVAGNAQNPVTHDGFRLSLAWDIAPNWDLLLTQSVQNLDAEGSFYQFPLGAEQQKLDKLQVTSFSPQYDKDNFENTAWTLNGTVGEFKVVYTGSYMDRHLKQQVDYTNYSRTGSGQYYSCADGNTGFGNSALPVTCYSPVTSWYDKVQNTHLSNEFRVSTPDTWRLRGVAGVFHEQYRIYDVMNFNYTTIANCGSGNNLAIAQAGGAGCVGSMQTVPGTFANQPGVRGPTTGFGEDVGRGYDQTAFFGQLDFDILSNLTLSVGTRHFEYDEFEEGSLYHTTTSGCNNVLVCAPYSTGRIGSVGGTPNLSGHVSTKFTGFKSRFGIQYKPNDHVMLFYTYSEGFRPGGFSRTGRDVAKDANGVPQLRTPLSYAPDDLINHEVGVKSELFEHRLQLNFTAYSMAWKNTQLALYNPTQLGNTTFLTNGPDYNINGVELQFNGRVTEGLSIQGSVTYNENRQANSPCLVANLPGSLTPVGQCITKIGTKSFVNPFGAKGAVSAFSPQMQANLRARYDWTVSDYKAFASLDGNYTSHMYNEPATYLSGNNADQNPIPNTTTLRYRLAPYATLGGSIGVTKDNWTFQIFGSNLLNSNASTFTTSAQFIKAQVPLRPRVVGVKISQSF